MGKIPTAGEVIIDRLNKTGMSPMAVSEILSVYNSELISQAISRERKRIREALEKLRKDKTRIHEEDCIDPRDNCWDCSCGIGEINASKDMLIDEAIKEIGEE